MKNSLYVLALSALIFSCDSGGHSPDVLGLTQSHSEIKEVATSAHEAGAEGEQVSLIRPEKIIKTADIKFEVADYQESKKAINDAVSTWGGYISNENERTYNHTINNDIVIRISNKNFEKLLSDIGKSSVRMDYKRINSLDVSEEYVDIVTRLKTKKEVVERYKVLLKKAEKVEDILKIEREIRLVQEEIEAKEGRLNYLDSRISFSTINLTMYQTLDYNYKPTKAPNFLSRLYKALDNGWKGLLSVIVGIINLWPLFLVVGLILIFILKKKKKIERN